MNSPLLEEIAQLRAQITRSRYDPSSVGPDAPFFVALERLSALAIQSVALGTEDVGDRCVNATPPQKAKP